MLTDEQRQALINGMGDPKEEDGDINAAIRLVARALKEPEEEPEIDHRPELHHIEGAIRGIQPVDLTAAVEAIRALDKTLRDRGGLKMLENIVEGLNGVSKAVVAMNASSDLSAVQKAIEENTEVMREMVQAISQPKRLVMDDNNRVIGMEVGRAKGRGLN